MLGIELRMSWLKVQYSNPLLHLSGCNTVLVCFCFVMFFLEPGLLLKISASTMNSHSLQPFFNFSSIFLSFCLCQVGQKNLNGSGRQRDRQRYTYKPTSQLVKHTPYGSGAWAQTQVPEPSQRIITGWVKIQPQQCCFPTSHWVEVNNISSI